MTTTTTRSVRGALLGQWNDLGKKLLDLGEAIPAGRYDHAPAPGARSPGEVLRHLAFWNRWLAAKLRAENPDGTANEIPKKEAPTRAKALAALELSQTEAAVAFESLPGEPAPELVELFTAFLGHSSEHYGQLVVYARLKGVVPPASR